MGSKTKIIVLHMKEIIYTAVFAALGILLILLLVIMFRPSDKDTGNQKKQYTPGIYTSTLTLNNTNLEVEVSVDASRINSIRLSNLDESVAAMFPLVQPAIEDIAEQIYETQSPEEVSLSEETPYTSRLLLDAISKAIEKAAVD